MIKPNVLAKTTTLYNLLKEGSDVTNLCTVYDPKRRPETDLLVKMLNNPSLLKNFGFPELGNSDPDLVCLNKATRGIIIKERIKGEDKPIISIWKHPRQKRNEICVKTHEKVVPIDKPPYGNFATDLKLFGLIKTNKTAVLLVSNPNNTGNIWSFLILGIGKTKRGKKDHPKIRSLGKVIMVVNQTKSQVHKIVEQHKGKICSVKKQKNLEEELYCVIYAKTSNALISAVNQK